MSNILSEYNHIWQKFQWSFNFCTYHIRHTIIHPWRRNIRVFSMRLNFAITIFMVVMTESLFKSNCKLRTTVDSDKQQLIEACYIVMWLHTNSYQSPHGQMTAKLWTDAMYIDLTGITNIPMIIIVEISIFQFTLQTLHDLSTAPYSYWNVITSA